MRWLRMSAVLSPLIAGLIGAGALGAQAATGVVTGRVVDSASQARRVVQPLQGAIPMKCTTGLGGSTGSDVDWPVFRYAETLLSLSEAINEQRGPAEALPFVNQVRTRAGVPTWSGLSQAELRDSLLAERGRELYAEGVRRDDLIRAGKFISSALARGAAAKPGNVLFPIPLEVIQQSNGIITQNPGY